MTPTQQIGFLVERFPDKSIEEIKRITFHQLCQVYLCKRDDKGVPVDPHAKRGLSGGSYRETFWKTWRHRGKTEKEIEKLWEDYVLTNYVNQEATGGGPRNRHR